MLRVRDSATDLCILVFHLKPRYLLDAATSCLSKSTRRSGVTLRRQASVNVITRGKLSFSDTAPRGLGATWVVMHRLASHHLAVYYQTAYLRLRQVADTVHRLTDVHWMPTTNVAHQLRWSLRRGNMPRTSAYPIATRQ